ncbi:hypothetical protein [Mycolicibacterium sp.]|uniref:hypothetical protein n=1 Tax=Mycolicibacterium sp. TaxID=2320850 RepID=UPI0026011FC6|nr:hypothetical protein [Mycolicibacterium sp.]
MTVLVVEPDVTSGFADVEGSDAVSAFFSGVVSDAAGATTGPVAVRLSVSVPAPDWLDELDVAEPVAVSSAAATP